MKIKMIIVLALCAFMSACGYEVPPAAVTVVHPPQVVVQQTPNVPMPVPVNNFFVIQRGAYAGCRGYVTGVYYSYLYGRVFNFGSLMCGYRVFYNVQICERLVF